MYFATEQYVRNLTEAVKPEFDYRGVVGSDWATWQKRFRERLSDLSGLTAMKALNAGVDLQPQMLDRIEESTYIRERWNIQTEPGVWIPFYYLRPLQPNREPMPVIITPHGHGRRGKEVYIGNYNDDAEREHAVSGERDIALQAVSHGYAVIAPDQRGFWQMAREEDVRLERRDSCQDLQQKAMLFGRTLIGERIHDVGRLIDFIEGRPELDATRIGITGNSGGGTTSLFAAALDERIALSMPSACFCTYEASVLAIEHCPCNVIPGMLKLGEIYNVTGLIAPRPLLIIHGRDDEIFPLRGHREAVEHTKNIYASFDAEDVFEHFEGDGGHRYFKAPVWPFAERYLNLGGH